MRVPDSRETFQNFLLRYQNIQKQSHSQAREIYLHSSYHHRLNELTHGHTKSAPDQPISGITNKHTGSNYNTDRYNTDQRT